MLFQFRLHNIPPSSVYITFHFPVLTITGLHRENGFRKISPVLLELSELAKSLKTHPIANIHTLK